MTNKEQFLHYNKRPAQDIGVLAKTYKGARGALGDALQSAALNLVTSIERSERRHLKKMQKAAGDAAAMQALEAARERGQRQAGA